MWTRRIITKTIENCSPRIRTCTLLFVSTIVWPWHRPFTVETGFSYLHLQERTKIRPRKLPSHLTHLPLLQSYGAHCLSHIAKHLSANKFLLDSQHGFRQCLSTVTQLITLTHDLASTLQHRGQTDVILLDFSKAFDKVPHLRLSAKLNHYGIRGQTLDWIRSFLDNRTQAVSINGTHSSWGKVSSGVPQGSVLGPALFLLYINDIQDHIQSTMRLFADDSIVYREIVRPEDHDILQQDLQALADWSSTWLMQFNINKCAILTITMKRTPSHHQYKIFGETLERVDQRDYLGVTISHDLRWDVHCNKTKQKASRTLGLLRRTLSPCKQNVKAKAYRTLVRPQLEYASVTWNPYTLVGVNCMEQVQRAAARFVFGDYRRTTLVTPHINTLGWDLLHTRRILHKYQCSIKFIMDLWT